MKSLGRNRVDSLLKNACPAFPSLLGKKNAMRGIRRGLGGSCLVWCPGKGIKVGLEGGWSFYGYVVVNF